MDDGPYVHWHFMRQSTHQPPTTQPSFSIDFSITDETDVAFEGKTLVHPQWLKWI